MRYFNLLIDKAVGVFEITKILLEGFISGDILYPDLYPSVENIIPDLDELLEQYISMQKRMEELSSLKEGNALFCLQPYNGSGKRQLSEFDKASIKFLKNTCYKDRISKYEKNRELYEKIISKLHKKENFLNLTTAFDDYKGEIWIDHVHFSNVGAGILASMIVEAYLKGKSK